MSLVSFADTVPLLSQIRVSQASRALRRECVTIAISDHGIRPEVPEMGC